MKKIIALLISCAPVFLYAVAPPPPPPPPVISFDSDSSDELMPLSSDEESLLDGLEELDPWAPGQGADAPEAPEVFVDEDLGDKLIKVPASVGAKKPAPAPIELDPEENPALPPKREETAFPSTQGDPFAPDVFKAAPLVKAAPAVVVPMQDPFAPAENAVPMEDPFAPSESEAVTPADGDAAMDAMSQEDPFGTSPFANTDDAPAAPVFEVPEEEPAVPAEAVVGDAFMPGAFTDKPAAVKSAPVDDPFAGMPEVMPGAIEKPSAPVVTQPQVDVDIDPAHFAQKAWFYDDLKTNLDVVGEEKALAAALVLARAQDLEKRQRYYEAWRAYNDLVRQVPTSKVAKGALNGYYSRRLLVRAEGLEKQKRYFEAAHTYRDALLRNRNDVKAWYGLGKIYFQYKKHSQAIACFDKVVTLKAQGNEDLADWLKIYKIQSKAN